MPANIARLSALALLIVAADARASHYEDCDLQADVVSASALPGARRYDLALKVRIATPARGARALNYIDCRQYEGQALRVQLRVPSWKGEPQVGDTLVVNRSIVTATTPVGEGDVECIRFRDLRKASRRPAVAGGGPA